MVFGKKMFFGEKIVFEEKLILGEIMFFIMKKVWSGLGTHLIDCPSLERGRMSRTG